METLFVGKNLIFLPETNSTNSYAMELLKNVNLPEGTVVHTARQNNGRGQRAAVWIAEPGRNLTVSIILHPTFLPLSKQFFLYIISALAVHDTTAHFCDHSQFDIKIKWPNDILLNEKKIAGILIENKIAGEQISGSVIGIGINVNQERFNGLRATSIRNESGSETAIDLCLSVLCAFLEKHYLRLKSGRYSDLRKEYTSRLFAVNSTREFEIAGRNVQLNVEGISDSGLLSLRKPNGELMEADLQEIRWLFGDKEV